MDTGADCIARDIKAIVETRLAMAEKLGALEQHVGITMQHARTTMTEVADKTTSIVRETIHVAKAAIDPSVHAARHPWVFVGGALVLGYAVGTIYRRGRRISNGGVPYYPPGAKGAAVMPTSGSPSSEGRESGVYPFYSHPAAENGRERHSQADRLTVWAELGQALQDELGVARNSFIQFGRGLLRGMVRQAIPAFVQMAGGNRRERDPRSNTHTPHR